MDVLDCGSARFHRRRGHHGEDLLMHVHVGDAPRCHPLLRHAALRDVVAEKVVGENVGVAAARKLQDEVVVIRPRWREVEELVLHVWEQPLTANERTPTAIERPHGQDGMHLKAAGAEVLDCHGYCLRVTNWRRRRLIGGSEPGKAAHWEAQEMAPCLEANRASDVETIDHDDATVGASIMAEAQLGAAQLCFGAAAGTCAEAG
mmetsp:Transcript_86241/g.172192  ORF Transcript_86241/g.172192 Transcript_86241/m.172192 type:complete len:204 (-) Transcript_86241:496-1107(-)